MAISRVDNSEMAELFKSLNPPVKAAEAKKPQGLNDSKTMMTLFLAQLENQNPMDESQDPTKMIAQLAQMSQVEQANKTNDNLETIIGLLRSGKQLDAAKLLDKNILVPTDKVKLQHCTIENVDNKTNIAFDKIKGKVTLPKIPVAEGEKPKNYSEVRLKITTADNSEVAVVKLGPLASGGVMPFELNQLDGIFLPHLDNDQINAVLAGELKIKVQGITDGVTIDGKTSVGTKISAVTVDGNDYVVSAGSVEKIRVQDLNEIY